MHFFDVSFEFMLYGLAPKLKFSIDQFRFKATPIRAKHNVPLINFNKYINLILFGMQKYSQGICFCC